MEIKFKKLSSRAVIPRYSREDDAGADITATRIERHERFVEYGTDLAVSIPKGYVGFLCPRSSITNKELVLKNSVGVLDTGFFGEIKFRFYPTTGIRADIYKVGDRIGQLVIVPVKQGTFIEVDDLGTSDRGIGGYGSTGL